MLKLFWLMKKKNWYTIGKNKILVMIFEKLVSWFDKNCLELGINKTGCIELSQNNINNLIIVWRLEDNCLMNNINFKFGYTC